ncbi:hypothetical protein Q1695_011810 [Nippostrongylus brasiliensis]|nr:hypothetical protein Q1695_011810 [Nippostrongylus brasiliensis]
MLRSESCSCDARFSTEAATDAGFQDAAQNDYFDHRLKSIELRKSAPGLNKRVAKAFVRNALWDPSAKRPREDIPVENTSAQSRDNSEASEAEDVFRDEEVQPVVSLPDKQPSYAVTNIKFEDIEAPPPRRRVKTGKRFLYCSCSIRSCTL